MSGELWEGARIEGSFFPCFYLWIFIFFPSLDYGVLEFRRSAEFREEVELPERKFVKLSFSGGKGCKNECEGREGGGVKCVSYCIV